MMSYLTDYEISILKRKECITFLRLAARRIDSDKIRELHMQHYIARLSQLLAEIEAENLLKDNSDLEKRVNSVLREYYA